MAAAAVHHVRLLYRQAEEGCGEDYPVWDCGLWGGNHLVCPLWESLMEGILWSCMSHLRICSEGGCIP